jgi:hypothetical protein
MYTGVKRLSFVGLSVINCVNAQVVDLVAEGLPIRKNGENGVKSNSCKNPDFIPCNTVA